MRGISLPVTQLFVIVIVDMYPPEGCGQSNYRVALVLVCGGILVQETNFTCVSQGKETPHLQRVQTFPLKLSGEFTLTLVRLQVTRSISQLWLV